MLKKFFNVTMLLASIFVFGACSLNFKIPKDMPPQVIVPSREEKPVQVLPEEPVLEPGRNVMSEVLIPNAERKTDELLKQYQESLELLEKNLQ